MSDHLQVLLRKAGYNLSTSAERETVRMIKEKLCYIAGNPAKEEKDMAGVKKEEYRLPDGNIIKVRCVALIPHLYGTYHLLHLSFTCTAWGRALQSTRSLV